MSRSTNKRWALVCSAHRHRNAARARDRPRRLRRRRSGRELGGAEEHGPADDHRHAAGGPDARRPQGPVERQPDRLQRLLGALRQERRQLREHQRRDQQNAFVLTNVDVGNTIRFKVRAQNADGNTFASSVPTAVITRCHEAATPATGCPTGTGTVQVADREPPARLLIDQQQNSPVDRQPRDAAADRALPRLRLRRPLGAGRTGLRDRRARSTSCRSRPSRRPAATAGRSSTSRCSPASRSARSSS